MYRIPDYSLSGSFLPGYAESMPVRESHTSNKNNVSYFAGFGTVFATLTPD